MKLYIQNQENKFDKHLFNLMQIKVQPYELHKLKEKYTTLDIPCNLNIDELSFNFFFNYEIFPKKILIYHSEWQDNNRKMKVGDTILQQINFPPLLSLSQKMITGVRIVSINSESNYISFSYETLYGHVEKGISTFKIKKTERGLQFCIHTFSEANNLILRLTSSIFSSPYQNYCTKCALQNMKVLFYKENPQLV